MEIYYKNNYGNVIDFMSDTYRLIVDSNFGSYSWDYESTDNNSGYGSRINRFIRKLSEKQPQVAVSSREIEKALDTMLQTFEKDVINKTPGRLYINDCYIKCYIIAGNVQTDWMPGIDYLRKQITIAAECPLWVTEKSFEFSRVLGGIGKKYPLKYRYRYSAGGNTSIDNSHFADTNFTLKIKGPCINPEIHISGHIYALNLTLADGDTAIVNSYDGKIVKTDKYGNITNAFNSRNKIHDIFKKISPGINLVEWPGDFDFTITLFAERSEPLWT